MKMKWTFNAASSFEKRWNTEVEMFKYYQNGLLFNGVYSRDNLPKNQDGAYVINLGEYSNVGTHWIAKMNEVVNTFLLVGDKFIPEIHLKQPGFTYSTCGLFTKNKVRIGKFMQTKNTDYIYKNYLDEACFQHDMVYGKFKDLAKRTQSDKVLRDKAFETTSNPKYDGYRRGLASVMYKFFDKKSNGSGIKSKSNQELANELQLLENLKEEKFLGCRFSW